MLEIEHDYIVVFLKFNPTKILNYTEPTYIFLTCYRSGLEHDDMKIFYNYLTTSLFPAHFSTSDIQVCNCCVVSRTKAFMNFYTLNKSCVCPDISDIACLLNVILSPSSYMYA